MKPAVPGGVLLAIAVALALVLGFGGPSGARAASHREAPLISMDPEADITDFFMFRSYEAGQSDKVDLIMNVIPGEEPSAAPNYYNFDPTVTYAINLDNDKDGVADDLRFEFNFRTEFRGVPAALKLPLSYVGGVTGVTPITTLDGPGSEGLGLRQRYTVTMFRGKQHKGTVIASDLIAVPSNVGPRTMPSYDTLAAQGMYTLQGGNVRVFAGQRDDPFYIDLGGVFDSVNLRRSPPIETAAEDANDNLNPYGVDMLSGFNVNTIALQVPASLLTADGGGAGATATPVIGAYAETDRQKVTVRHERFEQNAKAAEKDAVNDVKHAGKRDNHEVQVQRLANPLVNETIIGTVDKDLWNSLDPEDEGQFEDYYLNPRLATALFLATGVPAADHGRTDLRDLLLKYAPSDQQLSELLRLNVNVAPTTLAAQRRMGPLAAVPDPAAWPNGRRPKDDVLDIAVRVVGGPNYIAARASDGVNTNDKALPSVFPFLASPWDGRNRVHGNP
jgi:Domain of unknown function (DUF4331)